MNKLNDGILCNNMNASISSKIEVIKDYSVSINIHEIYPFTIYYKYTEILSLTRFVCKKYLIFQCAHRIFLSHKKIFELCVPRPRVVAAYHFPYYSR